MHKFLKSFYFGLLALTVCGLLSAAPAFAQTNPVTELNGIADQLIGKLKANKANLKDTPGLVYSLANQVVLPHADIAEMSKRVLSPKVWDTATTSQRAEFEKQFSALLIHTYASALANYNDQTIHFYPVRGGYEGKSSIQVNSQIERQDGPSIAVNYRMVYRAGEWKLYDMSVEGVSMLESFRSQFSDELAQGNMDSLLKKLKAHNGG